MKKVVRIGTMPVHNGKRVSVYCEIEYDVKGRLSIIGVIGPTHGGDAIGGCGQIDSTLREEIDTITLAPGWTREMLDRFLDVWDRWHLNDMRAYDAEMKKAGWDKLAQTEMLGYKFRLNEATLREQRAIKEEIDKQVREKGGVQLKPEAQVIHNLPYEVVVWVRKGDEEPKPPSERYERAKHLYGHWAGNVESPESKTLGWLYPKDHPDGLLGRKLRPDGPGYGTAHFSETVPGDVIEFLKALPDTDKQPAWV
jgi:hypothetical protein